MTLPPGFWRPPKPVPKDPTDDVGYGKPPRHAQFRPGQSGNPTGRPRKTVSFKEILERNLLSPITVTIRDKPRKITTREALLIRLLSKALNGDNKSIEQVFSLMKSELPETGDRLSELLQEFKAANARLSAEAKSGEGET